MRVPYMARIFLYARRVSSEEVALRILCLTEPERAENPLELQEDFIELCHSDYVEIIEKSDINVKFSGNLLQVETDDRKIKFRPFYECRESYTIKRRNDNNPYPKGKIILFTGMDNLLFETKVDLTKFCKKAWTNKREDEWIWQLKGRREYSY